LSESYVRTLVEELSKVLSAESVVGEPIVQDDKVLIPVIRIGFGLGAGSGGSPGDATGEGGGGAGGIDPVAVLAVFKDIPGPDGVQVLPLKAPSQIPRVIESAVQAIAKMRGKKEPEKKEEMVVEGEEEPTIE
jgi:uncharacterized spore protein YtfJ